LPSSNERSRLTIRAAVATAAVAAACTHPSVAPNSGSPTLKDAFAGSFRVGAAVNERQFTGRDSVGAALIRRQFNTITPENVLKWENVHPRLGVYDFAAADRYVDFGEHNGMFVVGHTLVWHSQVPRWVFQDAAGNPVSRDTLLARMRDHIFSVVGRYKGRIKGWDVVNEALNEDGTLRRSPWYTIIGEDYLVRAFQFAHEADPSAQLYYNDYSLDNAPKRNGAVALVKRLQAAGIPIYAVGSQSHDKMDWPSAAQVDSTIRALSATGVKVNVTEFDIDVLPAATQNRGADVSTRGQASPVSNPYAAGLPDSVQRALAARYADLFRVFASHRGAIDRVTFWGVGDGDSWLNNWPVPGRTSYPLLFDRADRPKPAFDAVMSVAARASAR
jgi:endo-1,4-beta-xylanase